MHDVGTGELTAIQEVAEVAELYIAGGSGYGDPLTRDYEYVRNDVLQGYISHECAERVYGCIFKKDGTIDINASETLRKSMQDSTS